MHSAARFGGLPGGFVKARRHMYSGSVAASVRNPYRSQSCHPISFNQPSLNTGWWQGLEVQGMCLCFGCSPGTHTGSGSILLDATDRDSLSSMCGLRLGRMMRHTLVCACSTVCSHATVQFEPDRFIWVLISLCRFYTQCNDALC